MNVNIRRLGAFFLVIFAVMVGDITYWQVIAASSMVGRADNPRQQVASLEIRRGLIVDRNGVVLAQRTIDAAGLVHRSYSDPSLSQVIGYDSLRYGKSELESTYDDYLTGKVLGTSWHSFIDQLEHKPVVGDNLTLTIDDRLQQQVASFLPGSPSAAIVANPHTGEILAMASNPGFDANQVSADNASYWSSLLQDPQSPLVNRAVDGYYPPGSTFKVATLSAALDTGVETLDTQFDGQAATGPLTVDSHTFCDNVIQSCAPFNNLPAGVTSVSLEQALMYSDNIVFAQVGLKLGKQRFLDYARRFGVDQTTPFDIPVQVSHVATPGETFDNVQLASTAFGQGGLNVTPLQMLMVTEAQANGGVIPRPVLVKQVTSPDGSVVKSASYGTLYQPESAATAAQVTAAMVQVVQGTGGSGFEAQIPGIQVAGKTGTAETGGSSLPHAWFVCFAPADHPRVAVVVIVEHGGEGAFVAAPIARKILQAALSIQQ
ncbi:MAG TPA: penicillin-binding transpeptidase domain-containing protein [Chloroflexota bacterium]|nr:penicillin-binding transpeptidase domain-containing protein [Chloroflexota bacterium]